MKGHKKFNLPVAGRQGVAELGHELGNVLNGLLGMTRLVRDSGLNAEQERWLRAIEQSGHQMQRLVDGFRMEPDQPGEVIEPNPVDLDGIELLEEVLLAHAPAARANADRLLLIADPAIPRHWHCDPCLLRQLLDNLLGNAIKFTQSGEVVLEAVARAGKDGSPQVLCIAVGDSGPGIDVTLGRRMFGAYERGEACGAGESNAGLGLGLYICQRIVDSMGGEIDWSSPAAGGARFEVSLPGVLATAPVRDTSLPSEILRSLECHLDLPGPLQRALAGCLARLNVPWFAAGRSASPPTGALAQGRRTHQATAGLRVSISELQVAGDHPGPHILLRAETTGGQVIGCKSLPAPILECSLGPLLLELALEWHWIRNETPGSAPGQHRSELPDDPDSHPA